jgi:glycosyltransferase involved in cell wall biosynthesis
VRRGRLRRLLGNEPSVPAPREFAPIAIREIELAAPLEDIPATTLDGAPYGRARVLVRLHSKPLGVLDLEVTDGSVPAALCASAAWKAFADKINDHLRADGLPDAAGIDIRGLPGGRAPRCLRGRQQLLRDAPPASVIICTRNRADVLERNIRSLHALDYPSFEVMVVDGSGGSETANLVRREFPGIRYLHVGENGKSVALNRGIAAASGSILAFTDDDVRVDRHWLVELVGAFGDDPHVACTTGVALPLEIETPAQLWFEESGAFTAGFERRAIDIQMASQPGSLLPYATGKIGAGVNMAWRKSALDELGGFDVALDTLRPPWPRSAPRGTAAEDLAAFFDALVSGYRIVFEPGAIVYHQHRRTEEELARQLYWHGIGLGAYLTRCLATRPARIIDFSRRVPRGVLYGFASGSQRNRAKSPDFPPQLTRAEFRGVLHGPFAYFRGLPMARRLRLADRRTTDGTLAERPFV